MEFENNIRLIYGEKGEQWLKDLPCLIAQLAAQWNLKDLKVYPDLTYNYVLKGQQEEHPIVLKVGIDFPALRAEYAALQAFKGYEIVSVIDADLDQGAILLHRAIPGETLVSLFPREDLEALEIACQSAVLLHQASIPVDYSFPLLGDWLKIIDREWELPSSQLNLARKLKNDLLENSKSQALLHGDLHHGNILSDGEKWVVIDPKGVIGDPLYDMTGCLLREPFEELMQQPDVFDLLNQRMEFVAHFTQKPLKEIWEWTYVQTVMSTCWSLEDGQDVGLKRKFLGILDELQGT
jgi:streptomycin 6-kinase